MSQIWPPMKFLVDRWTDTRLIVVFCSCFANAYFTWIRCKKTVNYLICFNIYCPEIWILNFVTYCFWGQLQLQLSETTLREQLQSFGVREMKGCKRSIKIDNNALARKVVVNESCIWGWRIFLFRQRIFEVCVAVIHGWCQQWQPQWSISVRTVLCFYLFLCSCFISHCMILVLCYTYESLSPPHTYTLPPNPF